MDNMNMNISTSITDIDGLYISEKELMIMFYLI